MINSLFVANFGFIRVTCLVISATKNDIVENVSGEVSTASFDITLLRSTLSALPLWFVLARCSWFRSLTAGSVTRLQRSGRVKGTSPSAFVMLKGVGGGGVGDCRFVQIYLKVHDYRR